MGNSLSIVTRSPNAAQLGLLPNDNRSPRSGSSGSSVGGLPKGHADPPLAFTRGLRVRALPASLPVFAFLPVTRSPQVA